MKIFGYMRVSTEKQELERQRLIINDYAYQNNLKIDEYVSVKSSALKSHKQRRLDYLTERLEKGDLIIVSEISRIGRSVGEIIRLVDKFIKLEVRFVAIKEGIRLDGKQDIQTKIMVTLFGLFADIERDLISERTKQGLEVARQKGKILGRPKGSLGTSVLDPHQAQIIELLNKGVSKSSIAKIFEVSRSNLVHYIQSRNLLDKTH